MVLNLEPLDSKSSTLTTRQLLIYLSPFYISANIVQFQWDTVRARYSFSAQSIFHSCSYTKCHSSFRTIKQNKSLLLVKNNCSCLILLFRTWMFGHLFLLLYFSWSINIVHFIENVFMCLMTYFFAITKDSIIQNLFQKLKIFKTECSSSEIGDYQWHKTFCNTSFYRLDLVFFFKLSKYVNVVISLSLIFSFFHMATNALAASWVTFSNTRIYFVFFSILTER